MKGTTMSGGPGTLLLGLVLCCFVGEAEGGRVTEPEVDLVPVVAQGLLSPFYLTHAGDGSGQLFVVERLERFGSSCRTSFRRNRFSTSRIESCRGESAGCSGWRFTRTTGRTADFS